MSDQEMLLRKINAIDFALWELHIFLDTHPCNREALAKHDDLSQKRIVLAEQYEERFGPLEENTERWSWVDSPWPWEADFEKGMK